MKPMKYDDYECNLVHVKLSPDDWMFPSIIGQQVCKLLFGMFQLLSISTNKQICEIVDVYLPSCFSHARSEMNFLYYV